MPLYVQTLDDGTPKTSPIKAFIDCCSGGMRTELAARARSVEEQLDAVATPGAVSTADLRCTADPVLVYGKDGCFWPAAAYVRSAQAEQSVAPPPTPPISPDAPKGKPSYKGPDAPPQPPQTYAGPPADPLAQLLDEVEALNVALRTIEPTASSGSSAVPLTDLVCQLVEMRCVKPAAVESELELLQHADSQIVSAANAYDGTVTEAALANAIALHALVAERYAKLLECIRESTSSSAAMFVL
jgi:hypothetical protein